MAKSPKKSGSKKDSPKKSKKESPSDKKGKKSPEKRVLPKWSAEECEKADLETFARRRYEAPMDPSYKRVARNIALIVRKVHIFEVFNEVPSVPQFCNSNKGKSGSPKGKSGSPKGKKGSPKEKGSPKKGGAAQIEEAPPPEYEEPIIEGVVAIRRPLLLQINEKLFIEVTATWRYAEDSLVTPFPPKVRIEHQCYRDYYYIQPSNFERSVLPSPYNQTLITKIRHEYGAEWEGYPFYFSLSGAPDSLTFNRPYNHKDPTDGIFWQLRCFIGKYEFTKPVSDREVRLNFWKYTIAPSLLNTTLRKCPPFKYCRFKTLDDIGDLYLSASLDRDLYYHGDEIIVTVNVENNSQRHVIPSVTIYFEQNYRFFNEIPHDNSISLGEVWLKPGENGLPINPKSKNWTKTVNIKPMFDWSKYNLVIDGKMERDEKVFLASSTIIMKTELIPPEELEKVDDKGGSKKGSPGKKEKSSPKAKSSKKDSPKKGKDSPKKGKSPPKVESPVPAENELPPAPPTRKRLINREMCHPVFISYDIVVRLNMKTPSDFEAGHPQVRVPFILTRETRYINKWTNPPTYNHRPLKCDGVHTMKSQGHPFCTKLDKVIPKDSPQAKGSPKKDGSKKGSPKKEKSSPKSKSKSKK